MLIRALVFLSVPRHAQGGIVIKKKHANRTSVTVLAFGLTAWSLAAVPVQAADPQSLQQAIERGKQNFLHNTFGGPGRVCDTCHLGAGTEEGRRPDGEPIPRLTNAARIFPRISEDDGKLITLSDQVRICVSRAIKGKPPAYDSDELKSIVAYLTSLSQGKPIEMGGELK